MLLPTVVIQRRGRGTQCAGALRCRETREPAMAVVVIPEGLQLSRQPISTRHHSLCGLALSSIQAQPLFSKRLQRRHPGFGDTFFIDEVFVTIAGRRQYLWRAVDQDGDVIDVYLQTRRKAEAARRFFRRLLRFHGKSPWKIVTDKLVSYGVPVEN